MKGSWAVFQQADTSYANYTPRGEKKFLDLSKCFSEYFSAAKPQFSKYLFIISRLMHFTNNLSFFAVLLLSSIALKTRASAYPARIWRVQKVRKVCVRNAPDLGEQREEKDSGERESSSTVSLSLLSLYYT